MEGTIVKIRAYGASCLDRLKDVGLDKCIRAEDSSFVRTMQESSYNR